MSRLLGWRGIRVEFVGMETSLGIAGSVLVASRVLARETGLTGMPIGVNQ
jgi:hypothetical protein